MLGGENWIPTAAEALAAKLIDEVVPNGSDNSAVVARAVELVESRVATNQARRYASKETAQLRRVNAEESAQLANAFVSSKFLGAMEDFNRKRKKAWQTECTASRVRCAVMCVLLRSEML